MILLRKIPLVASETQLRRSTKHKPRLDEVGLAVIKIRLRLTCHDLYGIYAEGISVYLPNGINNVPGLVETLEPVAFRERIYITTSRMSDQKIMEVVPPPPLTN